MHPLGIAALQKKEDTKRPLDTDWPLPQREVEFLQIFPQPFRVGLLDFKKELEHTHTGAGSIFFLDQQIFFYIF